MSLEVEALRRSVEHLAGVVAPLTPEQIRQRAYPTDWSVADTLSHIGSGAVIFAQGLTDVAAGQPGEPTFNQSVWDEWNAKDPDAQAADAIVVDRAMMVAIDALDENQRRELPFKMGPFEMNFDAFVGLRFNEHVLHVWDVEVVVDPTASLSENDWPVMISTLALIAGFASKPDGSERTLHLVTSDTGRGVTLVLTPDAVQLSESEPAASPDLALPAEAFVRLVNGRLDPDHTPAGIESPLLAELRSVFPGF